MGNGGGRAATEDAQFELSGRHQLGADCAERREVQAVCNRDGFTPGPARATAQ